MANVLDNLIKSAHSGLNKVNPQKFGAINTVTVRGLNEILPKNKVFTVNDIDGIVVGDIVEEGFSIKTSDVTANTINVTINNYKKAAFELTASEHALLTSSSEIGGLLDNYFEKAFIAIATGVETSIIANLVLAATASGNAVSSNPVISDTIIDARTLSGTGGLVTGAQVEADLLKDKSIADASQFGNANPKQQAFIGRLAGFNVAASSIMVATDGFAVGDNSLLLYAGLPTITNKADTNVATIYHAMSGLYFQVALFARDRSTIVEVALAYGSAVIDETKITKVTKA